MSATDEWGHIRLTREGAIELEQILDATVRARLVIRQRYKDGGRDLSQINHNLRVVKKIQRETQRLIEEMEWD